MKTKRSSSLRNNPCHCGSGKKFKQCHGDEAKASEARQEAMEQSRKQLQKKQEEISKVNPEYNNSSARMRTQSLMLMAVALGRMR